MNYKIKITENFEKQAKKLLRKYSSFAEDLQFLEQILTENPFVGESLGGNIFKIRVAIKSKGKGKSSGARVITFVLGENETVFLLSVYDKSEISTVRTEIMREYAAEILENLQIDAKDRK